MGVPGEATRNAPPELAASELFAVDAYRHEFDSTVAEAVGDSYSEYARISTFTGLPTVLGWPNHEGQWRDLVLQGTRKDDIQTLYTTPDWVTTQGIIDRYQIRYIVVGNLERTTYQVNEEKFSRFLKPIFQQGSITVYEVP